MLERTWVEITAKEVRDGRKGATALGPERLDIQVCEGGGSLPPTRREQGGRIRGEVGEMPLAEISR